MSGLVSVVLLPIRYAMVIGFAVLGLLYYGQLDLETPAGIDFERILPSAILQFVPMGLMGLLLAGFMAAFMGTFAGTLNAAQAYFTNDIYLKYIRPKASNRAIRNTNYLAGIGIAIIGISLGFFAEDVNSVLQWIVSALYGGYIAANMLKWYWWRFNASGFFWGMLAGIVPALVFPLLFDFLDLYYFPLLFALSLAGAIVGSLCTPPTDTEVLKEFYRTVKPWGAWKPIRLMVMAEDPTFTPNTHFKRDMFNVVLGIIGQLCLTILPIYLVLMMETELWMTILLLAVIVITLKKTWWNKLEN